MRSYMSCQDIAQCFNTETKKMVDYAWRPVTGGRGGEGLRADPNPEPHRTTGGGGGG